MPSNCLILCRPLLPRLQSFLALGSFPMNQLFASGGQSIGASASVLPKNIQGLISFRIDWFDLLAVQGTLRSLLQHHSSKSSILQCSFTVQFSQLYRTSRKTIALTLQNFVGKMMPLLFNMLSKFVIAFFSKKQASFNFMAAVTIHGDFGAQENKVCHCFHCFPIYFP